MKNTPKRTTLFMVGAPSKVVGKITHFSDFYANALKIHEKNLICFFSFKPLSEQKSSLKIATIASKKGVHKRAVKRNKARRRIKNALYGHLKLITLPIGFEISILFIARKSILDAPWNDVVKDISNSIQKHFEKMFLSIEKSHTGPTP